MANRFQKLINKVAAGVQGLSSAIGGTAIADNAVIRGDGTTGIQGSGVTIDDSNNVVSPGNIIGLRVRTGNQGGSGASTVQLADDFTNQGIDLGSARGIAWGTTAPYNATKDVGLIRSGTATIAVTDGQTSAGNGNLRIGVAAGVGGKIFFGTTGGVIIPAADGVTIRNAADNAVGNFTAGSSSVLDITNSAATMSIGGNGGTSIKIGTAQTYAFSSTTGYNGTIDAALSRVAANVVGVGTGAAGNTGAWIMDGGGKRNTANQTVTDTTTLANSTDLTITVAAGRTYQFRCWLPFTTINTSGAKVSVSGAATHTNIIYDVTFFGISTPGFLTSGRGTAKDTAVGVTASGTACYALIEGTTTVNAGGAMTIQFAQNAETGAAESVILLRGATFTLTDVA